VGRFTYRCDEEKAMRIKALKARTGFSFQKLCDMFIDSWLWKLQHETDIFRDLTTPKQIEYTTKDIAEIPSFRLLWFIKRK
jgi:hypothetical protein